MKHQNTFHFVAKPFFRIALMVEASSAFGRAICQGVSRFAKENEGWLLLPYKGGADVPSMLGWLQANRIDGVICCVQSREQFIALQESGIPLVNVVHRDAAPGVTSVIADFAGIARMAADFFLRAGFWNFAYCGYPGLAFSELRGTAFRNILRAHSHTVHIPTGEQTPSDAQCGYEHAYAMQVDCRLKEWLCQLPKPVALLACNDVRGQQIIRLAQECGIDVPGALAVLGVDNDEVICNLCTPALSSIDPGGGAIGHAAARALDGLLRGTVQPGTEYPLAPSRIVERQSTGLAAVENPLVLQALHIIRNGARDNLTIPMLCAKLHCSRAKLDRLFKKHLGRTSSDEMTRVRVKQVTEVLCGTSLSLKEVAAMFNFSSAVCFSQFIRRETGCTPQELRRMMAPNA